MISLLEIYNNINQQPVSKSNLLENTLDLNSEIQNLLKKQIKSELPNALKKGLQQTNINQKLNEVNEQLILEILGTLLTVNAITNFLSSTAKDVIKVIEKKVGDLETKEGKPIRAKQIVHAIYNATHAIEEVIIGLIEQVLEDVLLAMFPSISFTKKFKERVRLVSKLMYAGLIIFMALNYGMKALGYLLNFKLAKFFWTAFKVFVKGKEAVHHATPGTKRLVGRVDRTTRAVRRAARLAYLRSQRDRRKK